MRITKVHLSCSFFFQCLFIQFTYSYKVLSASILLAHITFNVRTHCRYSAKKVIWNWSVRQLLTMSWSLRNYYIPCVGMSCFLTVIDMTAREFFVWVQRYKEFWYVLLLLWFPLSLLLLLLFLLLPCIHEHFLSLIFPPFSFPSCPVLSWTILSDSILILKFSRIKHTHTNSLLFFKLLFQVNNNPPQAKVWRNYNYPPGQRSRYPGAFRINTVTAVRATSAAPTFFTPVQWEQGLYCDGALVANNPTAIALQEAKVSGNRGLIKSHIS